MDCEGFIKGIPNTESINFMDWDCVDGEFGALNNFFTHEWDLPMEDVVDVPNDWNAFGPIPSEIVSGLPEQPLFQPVNTLIGKDLKLLQKYVKDDNHSPEESVVIQTQNYSTDDDTACSDFQPVEDSPPLKYEIDFPTKRRSKRSRLVYVNPWLRLVPFIIATKTKSNSLNQSKRRVEYEELENSYWQPVATKKCSHCEVTKTPQWREGPMGPKTLCNACGVRYRSGRLLPEYRPAASPTFVPYLHSNSHRKVIAMRNKGKQLHHVRIDEEPNFYPMVENLPSRS